MSVLTALSRSNKLKTRKTAQASTTDNMFFTWENKQESQAVTAQGDIIYILTER